MAKCPKCGVEVANPRKSWKMAGRPDKTGKRTELTIGLFYCPKCNKSFRKVMSKRKGPIEHPMRGPIEPPDEGPIGPPIGPPDE